MPWRRRGLSQLLLVLYIAAVHGLPALHLAWHKSDHVHELGGLRWLTPPVHVHASGTAHDAPAPSPVVANIAAAHSQSAQLRGSDVHSTPGAAPHLALGPAHAQQSLLAPVAQLDIAGDLACPFAALAPPLPVARELITAARARAPPQSV